MNSATPEGENTVSLRLGSTVLETIGLSQQQDDAPSPQQTEDSTDTTTDIPPSDEADEGGSGDEGDDEPTAEPDDSDQSSELPLDQVFEILKNSRRREALHYLDANGGEASLSDLAEHIAAIENDTTVSAISSSQRKRVYVGLYQCHLPKMDDMNIVDFNQNRGTIRRADNADQLDPYLDDSVRAPWHRMYGAVTVAGGGLFGVSVVANAPMGLTPTVVLAAFLVAMTICSIGHAYYQNEAAS